MTNQDFIDSLIPGAEATYKEYGVLPSITIAQAIHESGWGTAAPGNNLFGIKGTGPAGSSYLNTSEVINGQTVKIKDYFRAYNSIDESLTDHGKFLKENSNYKNVLTATNYRDAAQALQNAGYATDPLYASKIINIIESNNLQQYDNGSNGNVTTKLVSSSGSSSNAVGLQAQLQNLQTAQNDFSGPLVAAKAIGIMIIVSLFGLLLVAMGFMMITPKITTTQPPVIEGGTSNAG